MQSDARWARWWSLISPWARFSLWSTFLNTRSTDQSQQGVFGAGARLRVVVGYAVAFVIGLGVLNAWLHPFHRVRPCDGDCIAPSSVAGSVVTSPDQRPSVAAAARVWYERAKAAYGKAHGEGPVPMLIVVTAGGGIRAAYWTAEVLEKLAGDFERDGFKDQRGVRPYLFAISGVSGGSVGATAFDAALAERDESQPKCNAGDAKCPLATTFLNADFLAPALASLVFVDGPASFLPDFGQDDRSTALERSFETASGGLLTRPFLSLFPYEKNPAAEGSSLWRPILLLNVTHEETGKQIITGHVLIERDVFIDSLDALHVLGKDVRASTAAHNSARFTYISPAGDLGDKHGSVIDGGYFENYGALSALELARAARLELKDKKPGVKLVILMISSDPDLQQAHELVRIKEVKDGGKCLVSVTERESTPSGAAGASQKPNKPPKNYLSLDKEKVENAWINEFLAPFQGIKNVREAHGNRAAAELGIEVRTEFAQSAGTGTVGAPPQTLQMQAAVTADRGKDADVTSSSTRQGETRQALFRPSRNVQVSTTTGNVTAPTLPSAGCFQRRRGTDLTTLVLRCRNREQLEQLEAALGGHSSSSRPLGPAELDVSRGQPAARRRPETQNSPGWDCEDPVRAGASEEILSTANGSGSPRDRQPLHMGVAARKEIGRRNIVSGCR